MQIWFGVTIALLICLGGLTPPMGASVFMLKTSCKDPDLSLGGAFKACIPFMISMFIVCVILVLIPSVVTFLPDLLYK